jgi:VCBS repeat-containing protein
MVTANITDTIDETKVSLSATSEGTLGMFRVDFDHPVLKDTVVTLNQNDAMGNPITIIVTQNSTSGYSEVVMTSGEYHVKVSDVRHVGVERDDLEAVDLTNAEADIKVGIDVAEVCVDVKEDDDICEEGNLFIGDNVYNIQVFDPRANENGPFTLEGKYGTLMVNAENGDYKYQLNNDADIVQALNENELREDVFEIEVGNRRGSLGTKTVSVKVHGTNDIPVAQDDEASMLEDAVPIMIDVLANDRDDDRDKESSDTLTVFSLDGATVLKGSVGIVNNKLIYDVGDDFTHLAEGESEEVIIHYNMSDEQGATSSADVKITVMGVAKACPLKVEDDCTFVKQGATKKIDVLSNDSGTDLVITSVEGLEHGSIEITQNGTCLTYTADKNPTTSELRYNSDTGVFEPYKKMPFIGTETFTYTVEDSLGESATATVKAHIISTSDSRDKFFGTDGSDFVIAGKGDDYLSGGVGDDNYFFSKGDGHDVIVDSAGADDKIIFTEGMDRTTLSFELESDGDLLVRYGDSDQITVKYQEQLESIEKIEMHGGAYLDSNDIDKMVQVLSAYRGSEMDISEINAELAKDNTLGQIVWSEN